MIYNILERHPEGHGRVFRGVVFFMSITCIWEFSWEQDWEEIRLYTVVTTPLTLNPPPVFLLFSPHLQFVLLCSNLQVIFDTADLCVEQFSSTVQLCCRRLMRSCIQWGWSRVAGQWPVIDAPLRQTEWEEGESMAGGDKSLEHGLSLLPPLATSDLHQLSLHPHELAF